MPHAALKPARFLEATAFHPLTKTIRIFFIVLGGGLAFGAAGCHKNASAQAPQTLEQGLAGLRAALASANPEVQSNFYRGVSYDIRYRDYAGAALALQRLAGDPSLNGHQQQAVNEVSERLKQALAQPNAAHHEGAQ